MNYEEMSKDELIEYLNKATEFYLGDFPNGICIGFRGDDQWAVTDGFRRVLNRKNKWEYEPQPSSRTKSFLKRARFSLSEAFIVARKALEETV